MATAPWTYAYQPRFLADLKGMDVAVARRILQKLEAIEDDPLRTMKRLKGSDLFSLRVGDHRAYAHAHPAQRVMDFVRAGHRRNVHDR